MINTETREAVSEILKRRGLYRMTQLTDIPYPILHKIQSGDPGVKDASLEMVIQVLEREGLW
jgi:hypothetical protein